MTENPSGPRLEEEIEADDASFSSVRISEFYSPRKVAFDLHLKLSSGRYLKIFRAGENFEEAELKAYETDRGVRQVYFERSHRSTYISASSTLLQKITPIPAVPLRTKFGVARILSELYMQELYECSEDDRVALVEKGKEICSVLAAWVEQETGLEAHLLQLDQIDSQYESISFLTGLYACLLSKKFPWKSRRTTETLLLAAFFSDIGIFALSPELAKLKPKRMSAQQKREFEKHPELSYLLLKDCGSAVVPENIQLIVREHHEYCDGSGYPRRLTGDKILQLAKLITMSGDLVRVCSDFLLPPAEAVKVLFPFRSEKLFTDLPDLAAKYERELLGPFFTMFPKDQGEG